MATTINCWDDWPKDVVATLRHWNRERRLRFPCTGITFWCVSCDQKFKANEWGDSELNGKKCCDACLIKLARLANNGG